MFCTECGKELLEEAKFCNNCGSPISPLRINSKELSNVIFKDECERTMKMDEPECDDLEMNQNRCEKDSFLEHKTIIIRLFVSVVVVICTWIVIIIKFRKGF